ncbi:unnamed protein product [Caenorhabditis angaria]|uniref:Nudix hydrolase domain-containing protein n=1 Tax=Caenorhabditis angaria TaxID=860376 RepID=A0A9P1I9P0_9PELO|nr:unnamed protein product [Caenorhabditis angaria]
MSIWNHLVCKPIMSFVHKKCRNTEVPYLLSDLYRFPVPDEFVKWSKKMDNYAPKEYTDPKNLGKPWMDPEVSSISKWNSIDGKINRKSYVSLYAFDEHLRPINPMGRTGICGRGILGRWGPNHAADPIVTRKNPETSALEFVAIQRKDNGEWAIPGGMVDAGENVSETLKREFSEEAMSGVNVDAKDLKKLWENGRELYRGYVDDPRNTDNAWMETVVVNFHDSENILKNIKLQAGDDAIALRWIELDSDVPLYASHRHFIDLLKNNLHFV